AELVLPPSREVLRVAAARMEGGGPMSSGADVLVEIARDRFHLFHDPAGGPWAWDGTDALRLTSAAFMERLGYDLFQATGRVSSQSALTTATTTLRGIAKWDGPEIPVGLRVASQG